MDNIINLSTRDIVLNMSGWGDGTRLYEASKDPPYIREKLGSKQIMGEDLGVFVTALEVMNMPNEINAIYIVDKDIAIALALNGYRKNVFYVNVPQSDKEIVESLRMVV